MAKHKESKKAHGHAKKEAVAVPKMQKGHVLMRFKEDKFYNDQTTPLYVKDEIHNVPLDMKDRWLKRGGELMAEDEDGLKEMNERLKEEAKADKGQEGEKQDQLEEGGEKADDKNS